MVSDIVGKDSITGLIIRINFSRRVIVHGFAQQLHLAIKVGARIADTQM
jgi:hypothetical protein